MQSQIIIISSVISVIMCARWDCPEDATRCLSGDKHKEFASPETDDYAACFNYQDSTCCTAEFTQQLAESTLTVIQDGDEIFNWTHCGGLSAECERYIIEIECMYRCDPNLIYFAGEWDSSTDRIPICGQYCEHWFDACRADLACVSNFIFDWEYIDGENRCPAESECTTFEERYGDAETLCNVLWASTFNYTAETELCFTPQYTDVNDLVLEEMFGEQCGWKDSDADSDSNEDTASVTTTVTVGVIVLVIVLLLVTVWCVWKRSKKFVSVATVIDAEERFTDVQDRNPETEAFSTE